MILDTIASFAFWPKMPLLVKKLFRLVRMLPALMSAYMGLNIRILIELDVLVSVSKPRRCFFWSLWLRMLRRSVAT